MMNSLIHFSIGSKVKLNFDKLDLDAESSFYSELMKAKEDVNKIYTIVRVNSTSYPYPIVISDLDLCFTPDELILISEVEDNSDYGNDEELFEILNKSISIKINADGVEYQFDPELNSKLKEFYKKTLKGEE